MKVAIIGAGISGLACAIELEKNGIKPDIFEKRYTAGELFDHCTVMLEIITRPVKDPVVYLYNNFGIEIKPVQTVNTVYMHGPKVDSTLKRNYMGYFFVRGQDKDSVENQLYRQIKTPVRFDAEADYREIMNEYDYVVIATGENSVVKSLGCWQDLVRTWVYGSEVVGKFDPTCLHMWMDTRYSKSGYAYLVPFNSKRATLSLIIPYITEEETDYYWARFWEIVNPPCSVVKTFKLEHISGFVKPTVYKNLLFTGNAAGAIEPFLGFGQYFALVSGVLAARAIYKGEDYEKSIKKYVDKNMELLELRKALDRLGNSDFDTLIRGVSLPVIRRVIYGTDINIIKYSSFFVKELYSRFRFNYRR